jgi:putative transposase
VSLALPPGYTWTRRGQAYQYRVPSRWGSQGRINLIGTLALDGEDARLEYHLVDGSCRAEVVVSYLDALAQQTEADGTPTVIVLDNAPFHRATAVREREAQWQEQGLTLSWLPAYCPHLNRIEEVWKRLKGFLLPRRCYDAVAELTEAVRTALDLLDAVEVQCQLGDT